MSNTDALESMAIEVREPTATLALVPEIGADQLVRRLDVIREAMTTAMQPDVDYGHIPGTDKPALLKPGAEKLGVLFQLDVQLENAKTWGPGDHLTVESRATVYHAPTGARLGFGEGLCTTREKKYARRKQERVCPSCGAAAVIKGKTEYGGGWLCWKKRDGCGAKFTDRDPQIADQAVGDVDNPDLPDAWNTIVKMASKRARVDAVLAVTGASALFTQDVEPDDEPSADPPARDYQEQEQERTASDAEKEVIFAKATERSLPPLDFLNAIRVGVGLSSLGEEIDDEMASAAALRILNRLPARYVDSTLKEINDWIPF